MTLTSVTFDPFAAPALLRTAASTESQRELWTASQLGPDASAAFNESVGIRLRGSLDRHALESAFRALVKAHEALHTAISADGTSILVEVPSAALAYEDLANFTPEAHEERLRQEYARQVTEPFDLRRPPLVRARLLALAADEHLLLLSGHHIVCDGWSMSVLISDLAELYSRAVRGDAALALSRPRFSDYAVAERQRRGSDEVRAAERYWLDRLAGELPVVDLPSDRTRPPRKTYASDRVDHVLGAELVTRLKEVGARRGASFFVTLLASFQVFVHRIAGANDVITGIPAAGQSFTGESQLVGHCVNMLPIRTRLTSEQRFSELLGVVRSDVLDAQEHQQLTFGTLLQKLALPRDPSRLPLMTLSFNLDQAIDGSKLGFAGLEAEVRTTPRAYENFDLFINAAEVRGVVTLEAQYNSDLFDRSSIERRLQGFEALLRSIAATPDAALEELEMLTPAERERLSAWNFSAARAYPPTPTIDALLLPSYRQTPNAPALVASDRSFTYAELDQAVEAIAAELRSRGIGRDALVGIALQRSSRLVLAVLGVLRAGAAYVPLDPAFPRDRLSFMAEDAGLALLISERSLEAELPAPSIPRWFLDEHPFAPAAVSHDPTKDAGPEDPAYVIFTSGSTGKPKGVVVPQRGVVNFLRSMAERPGLRAEDRLLAVTTLSFDISVLELLLPLSVGATVVLATTQQASDGAALRTLLEEQRVSVLQATPATWRLLLGAGERFRAGFKALCGGEALPLSLADELLATGVELWNMYGPTETTVWSTCERIQPGDRRIRIGTPIANTQIHILDSRRRPVPIGVAGELCIAGDGVTLGYLKRPELTLDRFIANPFGSGKLYRTGDLARFTSEGSVEYVGRGDGQVKLRGYRIELGEIETVLGQHEGIRQAVVLVREDRPGDQRLVAYAVPTGRMPEDAELRRHLKLSLPDYMVPQHFVEMADLPLTANGKVDRKKLPAPVASQKQGADRYTPPATDTERMVQAVWQRVLGLEQVSITDDFFTLGGHSLLAAQVVAQIARESGSEISMRRIFDAPTVRALAEALDTARTSGAKTSAIVPRSDPAPAPLSPMQQRLWFLEEMNPGTSLYNLPSCFRLHGQLDRAALSRALDVIAERHSTLRTTLGWRDGKLCQTVKDSFTFDLTPVDLGTLPASERSEVLLSSLKEAAAEPFDLNQGPLVRAALFLLGPQESVLFFMPHHAVWDGWSFDVFLNELDRLYAAFKRGEPSPLPPLPITYGDYCVWQQQWLAGPELAKQTSFWLDQLSGELPVLELPIDAPRPASMTFAGATEPFQLSSELCGKLSEIGRRSGATLYMVLLAAFDVLLFRLSGQTDLIVGTPIRGRSLPELEGLIGYFVNALPLRMRLDPRSTFADLLGGVRKTCLQAFEHQEMPFEVLVQKLKIDRDTSRTPVYSAFFTFQDVRNRKSSVGDLSYEQIHVHPPVSPTELSLWVKQVDSGIVGGLDFATDIFQRETAARWLAEFQVLLESIVARPESVIAKLPLLTAEEQRTLAAISATDRDYPRELRLNELIEQQVQRSPDAVAVTCGDRSLTYRELDAHSNRLARALAAVGVGAGARVGICVERSLDLPLAALAVLKSGAAYVPLDPMFPEERLRFMADDAKVSAVIVHEGTRDVCPQVSSAKVVDLDLERERIASLESTHVAAPWGPASEAVAYVIYTSGSTGKPKGVMIPHAALVNFVTSMVREPGIRPADHLLAVTTLSFDIAVLELYAPLSVGAEVVIATREMIADGDLLDEAIAEHEISVMQATPATWRLLLGSGFRPPTGFKILCGGEAFPRDLAERLVETGAEVWNMYGPTETTVWSTCCKLERPLGDISIGLPIANTSIHIVDERGELCPLGTAGELWIGGDGVALGYHQRPELTAERFVPNPFRPGRAYRTGDIVRLRRGSLEYQRRNDNQVKVRGYRIELGDIEAALVAMPEVREAVLTVREVKPGDHRLIAYLIWAGTEARSESELRTQLRSRLPEYMIPQHFVTLAAFPQTPNGKVDRRALPDPLGVSEHTREGYVAPVTDNEKMLAALWQEILGISKVGARDNFFELGGHSLLCLQMTAKLEQRTGKRLNPRVILRSDLSQVAAVLPAPSASGPVAAPTPAPKATGERPTRSFSERLIDKLTRRRSGA